MIPGDPTREHRCLVVWIRVEVGVAETRLRCVQCRIGELDAAGFDEIVALMPVTCSARYQNSARLDSGSLREAVEDLPVVLEQFLGAGGEILVGAEGSAGDQRHSSAGTGAPTTSDH